MQLRSKGIPGEGKYVGKGMWKGKSFLNLLVVLEVHRYQEKGIGGAVGKIIWVQITENLTCLYTSALTLLCWQQDSKGLWLVQCHAQVGILETELRGFIESAWGMNVEEAVRKTLTVVHKCVSSCGSLGIYMFTCQSLGITLTQGWRSWDSKFNGLGLAWGTGQVGRACLFLVPGIKMCLPVCSPKDFHQELGR